MSKTIKIEYEKWQFMYYIQDGYIHGGEIREINWITSVGKTWDGTLYYLGQLPVSLPELSLFETYDEAVAARDAKKKEKK